VQSIFEAELSFNFDENVVSCLLKQPGPGW